MKTYCKISSRRSGGVFVGVGGSFAVAIAVCHLATPVFSQTLLYSFEDDLQGFGPNGGGVTVTQDTIGATDGLNSMKVEIVEPATFVGALTGNLLSEIGDPPGLDFVLFDLTIEEPFPEDAFAVVGVMIFANTQVGTAVQLQTGPSDQPELEFHIDGLEPGTYEDVLIDMTQFIHPVTFEPGSFNDIVGTLGSGPNDIIPTGFQLYFNKSGTAPLTSYIDNIRVGMSLPAVSGDYNENGIVDAADYTLWRDNLGQMITLPNTDPADTDGVVTSDEYVFWVSRFGETSGSGGGLRSAAVPEPGTAVLWFVTGLCWWSKKSRSCTARRRRAWS